MALCVAPGVPFFSHRMSVDQATNRFRSSVEMGMSANGRFGTRSSKFVIQYDRRPNATVGKPSETDQVAADETSLAFALSWRRVSAEPRVNNPDPANHA